MHTIKSVSPVAEPVLLCVLEWRRAYDPSFSRATPMRPTACEPGYVAPAIKIFTRLLCRYESLDALAADFISKPFRFRGWGFNYPLSAKDTSDLRDDYLASGRVVMDSYGDLLPLARVLGAFDRALGMARAVYKKDFAFREGPVSVRRGRGSRGHIFRYPKTTSEHRNLGEDWVEGFYVPVRKKRRNLPTAYHDLQIATTEVKNWKRHRQTQWKS